MASLNKGVFLQFFFICLIVLLSLLATGSYGQKKQPPLLSTTAKQALLVDDETGTVLFAKEADTIFNPASLTKLLLAETVFHALSTSEITEETLFKISEHTWRTGGAPSRTATMFASLGSSIAVKDLLRGLIIIQGNDAALALAEGIGNNISTYLRRMNERAEALGLEHTKIFSVTGLAEKKCEAMTNQTTAYDLITLARYIERNYAQYFPLYSEPAFEWNKIFQRNRNPLHNSDFQNGMKVDGFVTGIVEGKGYSLVLTAKHPSGRRLFLVLNGLESVRQREAEAKKLLEWGMNEFTSQLLYAAGEQVAEAKVYGGEEDFVPLKTPEAIGILLPKKPLSRLKIRVVYDGPLNAPVAANKQVGHLLVIGDDTILLKKPLQTAANVTEASLTKKALSALFEISFGWMKKYL